MCQWINWTFDAEIVNTSTVLAKNKCCSIELTTSYNQQQSQITSVKIPLPEDKDFIIYLCNQITAMWIQRYKRHRSVLDEVIFIWPKTKEMKDISLQILEILHDSQDIFIISSIKYLLHAFFLKHVGIFYVHQHDRRKIVFHYVLTGNELSSNTLPNTIR